MEYQDLRVLITGSGGFAGGHLAEHLAADTDWRLFGTQRPGEPAVRDARAGAERIERIRIDLRQPEAVARMVDELRPELVFHLAGQAFVPAAWQDPWDSFETNVRMQLNLLDALSGSNARLLAVSSNEVYGHGAEQGGTDETSPLAPLNPYASSKAAQDLLAGQYARAGKLHVVRVRPFNHIGPHQHPQFVLPAFARQVAEIEAGLRPPRLSVGNLEAERDFSDVRDIVRAYRLALEGAESGSVYNLGSGQPVAIQRLVEQLQARSRVAFELEQDPARLRPAEVQRSCCDAGLAQRDLGWRLRIPLEQSIADVLDEWRARVEESALAGRHDADE